MLSEAKFQELYNRQQASGLNVKDFCTNEGIAESTFYYWRKKLRKGTGTKDFIPLVVKSAPPAETQSYGRGCQPSRNSCETDECVLLELVYPYGTKLRIRKDLDLTHLRALISLYD